MSQAFISGVNKQSSQLELERCIQDIFLRATNQLSWLKPGQTVFLKPALNSNNPYPATSHPLLISVLKKIILEHGGKVIIGDQSGVESVVSNQAGVVKGNSADNYEISGMGKKTDFTALEHRGWDDGYLRYTHNANAWANGFYYTKYLDEADHFINLSRLSTHAQAGVTATFKNLVGILRVDSRLEFHHNGPFNNVIQKNAAGANLKTTDDGTNLFFEKMTEIGLAVKDKLRLNMCVGTQAQVTLGPDKQVGPLTSRIVTPEFGLIFASTDPVATELISTAELTRLYRQTGYMSKVWQKILLRLNPAITELGKYAPQNSPFIQHAIKIGLGELQTDLEYIKVPAEIQAELNQLIK